MKHLKLKPSNKIYAALLFAICFINSAYFFQGGGPNQNSRLNLAKAIAYEGTFKIDSFHHNTIDKAKHNGHYYSDKAPGLSFLAAPVLWIWKNFDHRDPDDFWLAVQQTYALEVLLLSFPFAFSAAFLFFFIRKTKPKLKLPIVFFTIYVLFHGTLLLPFSTQLFSHSLAASLVLIGTILIWGHISPIIGALILSYACLVEFTVLPFAALIFLLKFPKLPQKKLIIAAAAFPIALLAIYNHQCFDSPFSLGYGKLQDTVFSEKMSQGLFGITSPNLAVAFELLFGTYRGLLPYSPILLFCFAPLFSKNLRRNVDALSALAFSGLVIIWLINSSYAYWGGGASFGPRHLVWSLPLLIFPLIANRSQILTHPIFITLSFCSIVFMLIGTTVRPSPDENIFSPMWEFLFPHFINGDLSTNGHALVAGLKSPVTLELVKWRSFNLGQLISDKSGLLSITPLLLINGLVFVNYSVWCFSKWRKAYGTIPRPLKDFWVSLHAVNICYFITLLMQPLKDTGVYRSFRPLLDPVDISVYERIGSFTTNRLVPYKEWFSEYPELATYLFGVIGFLQHNISLPYHFLHLTLVFLSVSWLILNLQKNFSANRSRLATFLLLPSFVYFAYNRFDVFVLVLLVISLIHWGKRRDLLLLTIGGFLKWFPWLLLPGALVNSLREKGFKKTIAATIGPVFVGSAIISLSLYFFTFEGWYSMFQFHFDRIPNPDSFWSAFSYLFDIPTTDLTTIYRWTIPLAVLLGVYSVFQLKNSAGTAALSFGFTLTIFFVFNKIFSPQWILYSSGLLLLGLGQINLRDKSKFFGIVFILVLWDIVNYVFFPWGFSFTRIDSHEFQILNILQKALFLAGIGVFGWMIFANRSSLKFVPKSRKI